MKYLLKYNRFVSLNEILTERNMINCLLKRNIDRKKYMIQLFVKMKNFPEGNSQTWQRQE